MALLCAVLLFKSFYIVMILWNFDIYIYFHNIYTLYPGWRSDRYYGLRGGDMGGKPVGWYNSSNKL